MLKITLQKSARKNSLKLIIKSRQRRRKNTELVTNTLREKGFISLSKLLNFFRKKILLQSGDLTILKQ